MWDGGEAEHTLERANLALSIHTAAFLTLPAFTFAMITLKKELPFLIIQKDTLKCIDLLHTQTQT